MDGPLDGSLHRIEKFISSMSKESCKEAHEEAHEGSSCNGCQMMLKSFIETSIPYLWRNPYNPSKQSVALGRICFAA